MAKHKGAWHAILPGGAPEHYLTYLERSAQP